MNLAENIKNHRKRLKMTQGELGALCGGYTAAGVWKWETGKAEPNVEALCGIADAFGITIDELVGHESRKTPIVIRPEVKKPKEKEPRKSDSNEVTFSSNLTPQDFETLFQACVEKVLREKGMIP